MIQRCEKGMCRLPDRNTQVESCHIPRPKGHTSETIGNGTKQYEKNSCKTSISPKLHSRKRCIILDETTVHNRNKLRQNWMFSFLGELSDCIWD